MTRALHWRGAAWLLACTLAAIMAATLLSTQRAEADTIHDVVSQTWPAPLVPTAEQIAYHEGGGAFSDGYCGFGLIPSTQAIYGINAYAMDPYSCSAAAYQVYLDNGWGAWSTYGWYTAGAGLTPAS